MGVPRAHKTRGAIRRRRSHHALKQFSSAVCANCGVAVRPHEACSACGYYRGRQVMTPRVRKKIKRK